MAEYPESVMPRASRPFGFFKAGDGADDEFFPGDGTAIRYASRATDVLSLKAIPHGYLSPSDEVYVMYGGVKIFSGSVERIVDTQGCGGMRTDDVTVSGPWSQLSRLVFRQHWATSSGPAYSSRLVLNQGSEGSAIGYKTQIGRILLYATTHGVDITYPSLSGGQQLPMDEVRDLTCAQAINRVLRWFPKKIVGFDYSGNAPALSLVEPDTAGGNAAWTGTIDRSAERRTVTAHPVVGVDLEIETVSSGWRDIGHQTYGTTDSIDTLHATIQLAGAEHSQSVETFSCTAESIPTMDAAWWKARHPYLANYDVQDIAITTPTAAYFNGAAATSRNDYPRIADASVEQLRAFGLNARVETFVAVFTLSHRHGDYIDDKSESVMLSMQYVTSNVVNGNRYTRTVQSSSVSAETIPSGLAKAIYDDRSRALLSIDADVRLTSSLPRLGDVYDGLALQSFEIDCARLTASCHFGQPEHLSPDDMASLMSGFRNRVRSSSYAARATGKAADAAKTSSEKTAIKPMEYGSYSPGATTRKVLADAGKAIIIDPADVQAEGSSVPTRDGSGTASTTEVKMRSVELVGFDASGNAVKTTLQVLSSQGVQESIVITPPRAFDIINGKVVRCKIYCGRQLCTCADYTISGNSPIYLHISSSVSGLAVSHSISVDQSATANGAHSNYCLYELSDGSVSCDLRGCIIPLYSN